MITKSAGWAATLATCLVCAPVHASGTTPSLLADLVTSGGGAGSGWFGFFGRYYTTLGNTILFEAETEEHGVELWRTDGTTQGTHLVQDIAEGRASSNPRYLLSFQGQVFFSARDAAHGWELWRSDGTDAGTALFVDLEAGRNSSGPRFLTQAGAYFYFAADLDSVGEELFRSDGTVDGTSLIEDLRPGTSGSDPESLTAVGDLLFFTADDGVGGNELWVLEPGLSPTLVRDINPGSVGSNPEQLRAFGNRLAFVADDGTTGNELWISDGTEAGTFLVADIAPPDARSPELVAELGDVLLFSHTDGTTGRELWRSDGTAAGTAIVRDIEPGSESGFDPFLGRPMAILDGYGCFHAGDYSDRQIWRTDGTTVNTTQFLDVDYADEFLAVGDRFFFVADDGVAGKEPWASDGTVSGTTRIADIASGPADGTTGFRGFPAGRNNFMPFGDSILFYADDGFDGEELWQSDGTTEALVRDIETRRGSFPNGFTPTIGSVFFLANDADGAAQLFAGTPGNGSLQLSTFADNVVLPGSGFLQTRRSDGRAFFLVEDNTDWTEPRFQLWSSDGTQAGTGIIRDWSGGAGFFVIYDEPHIVEQNDMMYFDVPADSGRELWRSDGTAGGTTRVARFGTDTNEVGGLSATKTHVFVTVRAWPSLAIALLSSDGTEAGTQVLRPSVGMSKTFDEQLYFADFEGGCRLWKSDGTPAGTMTVIADDAPADGCTHFTVLEGEQFVFGATDESGGFETWISDSTAGGTQSLDLRPGILGSSPRDFTGSRDYAFFTADDGVHGREVWRSDATIDGTYMLKDINPGPASADAYGLSVVGSTLVFGAKDANTGYELWMSNGTSAGTVRISDVRPGPPSSLPEHFAAADSTLYFAADGVNVGVESWYVDVPDTDNDGMIDLVDNCLGLPNSRQRDTDDDGYGNACDADFDNNGIVDLVDLDYMRNLFLSSDPMADLDGSGLVNYADLQIVRNTLYGAPGPSGLSP